MKERVYIGGYTYEVKDGVMFYDGNLDLRYTQITKLPDNLVVSGDLNLSKSKITSLPDNLVVGGSLYLGNAPITSLSNNLVVGYTLDLQRTDITTLPDNLVVGGFLDLSGTFITSLPDNLVVRGTIGLSGSRITSLPDNFVVGRTLDLRDTRITSLPENLIVGGTLDLRGTAIKTDSLPYSLVVGDYIWLNGEFIPYASLDDKKGWDAESKRKLESVRNKALFWEVNGKRYVKADGVFSEVVSQKGNVYQTRCIGVDKTAYLITDGEGTYAHGETLQEARADLLFKLHKRDTSDYEDLDVDSVLPFEEAIVCYRVITGACNFGTADYIKNRLPQPHKKEYSIGEIIELTDGEYGSEKFAEFFTNRR